MRSKIYSFYYFCQTVFFVLHIQIMRSLQEKLFSKSYIASIIFSVLCLVLWLLPFIFGKGELQSSSVSFVGVSFLELSPLVALILQFVFFVVLGNVVNSFMLSLSLVPFQNRYFYYIFLLLISFVPQIHGFSNASIAFTFFLISITQLIKTSQAENVFRVFNSTFFLSIAVLFKVEYVYFLLFFILALLFLRAFTLRTFFASLLGMLSVAFIFMSILYLSDNVQVLKTYFALVKQMGGLILVSSLNIVNISGIVLLLVFLIFYVFSFITNRYTKSINVRSCSALVNYLLVATFIVYGINFQQMVDSLYFILLFISYFATLFYVHNRSKFANYSLIVAISIGLVYRIAEFVF